MASLSSPVVPFAPSSWATLPVFAPYRPWLARFVDGAWPAVSTWQATLSTSVSFTTQTSKLAVGIDADDVDGSYPDWCRAGCVPSREQNLHDFCNALVWARWPRAKAALCCALVDVARARGPQTHPRLRNKLQDRLAMIDEGGVVGSDEGVVFGHALLEDAVKGRASRGFVLDVGDDDDALVEFVVEFVAEFSGG